MTQVILIVGPMINWRGLFKTLPVCLGTNPVQKFDEAGIDVRDTKGFVHLAEMIGNPNHEPMDNLSELTTCALDHVNFTFLVTADESDIKNLMILTAGSVALIASKSWTSAILTAPLSRWHKILSHRLEEHPTETRRILNQILLIFEGLGLGELWSGYGKRPLESKTFTLE